MQGIGFLGEVDVDKIVATARTRLSVLEPFEVWLGPAVVDPEVVRLRVEPAEPVVRLRRELRAAIGEVWGTERVPDDEDDFTPHVSLAYSNKAAPMKPILAAATATSPRLGIAAIAHADLIVLNRDHRQYEWTTHTEVPLGK